MVKLSVPDMTCGHCVKVISAAIQALDAGARVEVDLRSRQVSVTSSASRAAIQQAVVAAGYTPTPA
jgi:copper chaperone